MMLSNSHIWKAVPSFPASILRKRNFPSAISFGMEGIDGQIEYITKSLRPRPRPRLAQALTDDFPEGLDREYLPNHVAVIMDGNMRWAKKKSLPPHRGHEAMFGVITNLYQLSSRLGIRVLTLFAFSIENWNRSKMETEFIMSLMERYIQEQMVNFSKHGVQLSIIGDLSRLPNSLQMVIVREEEATKNNTKLQLIFALSYSGQYDIRQACQNIAQKAMNGLIQPQDIDDSIIERHLLTSCTQWPYVDLLIRTSGELRLSNFLLWQLAYAELFFAESYWPDFGETEFLEALHSFQQRQRRFGKRDP